MNHFWRPSAWEAALIILIVLAGAWSSTLSPYYLSLDQIFFSSRQFIIPGLLALGLFLVVIPGEIDISVASTLAVSAVLFGKFSAAGLPIMGAVPLVIAAGALLGLINGVLVARFALPSLAVTLGTMGAYRGLAFIIGSATGYTDFDDAYLYMGSELLGGLVPVALVLFAAVTVAVGLLLHKTIYGRRCFAVGRNKESAYVAGIDVDRVKIVAYTLAGALAGLAALVWIGQYGSARGDNADGLVLFVVTAVVLAGVDINGGKGTVPGVLLSLLLLGTLRNGMGLANIAGPTQTVIFGTLLIFGVLRPVALRVLHQIRTVATLDRAGLKPARKTSV